MDGRWWESGFSLLEWEATEKEARGGGQNDPYGNELELVTLV